MVSMGTPSVESKVSAVCSAVTLRERDQINRLSEWLETPVSTLLREHSVSALLDRYQALAQSRPDASED